VRRSPRQGCPLPTSIGVSGDEQGAGFELESSSFAFCLKLCFGIGATVGSVIPTLEAIVPAAVGVDIGCGIIACKTTITAEDPPDNLAPLRSAIERAVPHGRAPGARDPGAWQKAPGSVNTAWAQLEPEFKELRRTGCSWAASWPAGARRW